MTLVVISKLDPARHAKTERRQSRSSLTAEDSAIYEANGLDERRGDASRGPASVHWYDHDMPILLLGLSDVDRSQGHPFGQAAPRSTKETTLTIIVSGGDPAMYDVTWSGVASR